MFNFFFGLNYWITTKIFRNNSYPIVSTIVVVSFYQFFAVLFLFDFLSFQVFDDKSLILQRKKIYGFIVISVFLGANYFYFDARRQKKVLSDFHKMKRSKKLIYSIFGVLFMIVILALTVLQAYSIKNHISWW